MRGVRSDYLDWPSHPVTRPQVSPAPDTPPYPSILCTHRKLGLYKCICILIRTGSIHESSYKRRVLISVLWKDSFKNGTCRLIHWCSLRGSGDRVMYTIRIHESSRFDLIVFENWIIKLLILIIFAEIRWAICKMTLSMTPIVTLDHLSFSDSAPAWLSCVLFTIDVRHNSEAFFKPFLMTAWQLSVDVFLLHYLWDVIINPDLTQRWCLFYSSRLSLG